MADANISVQKVTMVTSPAWTFNGAALKPALKSFLIGAGKVALGAVIVYVINLLSQFHPTGDYAMVELFISSQAINFLDKFAREHQYILPKQ